MERSKVISLLQPSGLRQSEAGRVIFLLNSPSSKINFLCLQLAAIVYKCTPDSLP